MTDSWHGLLLALAGVIPDAELAWARAVLAGPDDQPHPGDGPPAMLEVLRAVPEIEATLTTADLAAVAILAGRQGPAAAASALATVGLRAPDQDWQPFDGHRDLTGIDQSDPVLARLSAEPDLLGVWCVLRPGPERIVLAEVGDTADPVRLAAAALDAGRGAVAAVEVFRSGTSLPDYQRAALGAATLMWAAEARPPELVPVFDGVDDAGGPRFEADHPILDEAERAGVAAYLYQADPVLLTTALAADVVDPARGEVVPLTYRTDGRFIWPDAAGYYAGEHGLAPFGPLLAAIRSADHRPPATTMVDRLRAEAALFGR
ncbi:hypothetical protein [Actinoplanes sp. HUAS TT8]|uniref:hypothetical protein n=1 Tax=Actinoplanes sp. HUAS TT8 TaxID=3447453 RepID=UPI003F526EBA